METLQQSKRHFPNWDGCSFWRFALLFHPVSSGSSGTAIISRLIGRQQSFPHYFHASALSVRNAAYGFLDPPASCRPDCCTQIEYPTVASCILYLLWIDVCQQSHGNFYYRNHWNFKRKRRRKCCCRTCC